jgi:hypothetical protein
MFWLHLNDHWCFFLNFRWFYFKKGNHVCLKENAVPIWYFFSTVPKCLGAELSFLTGAEMSWCQTSLMHVTLYREDAPFFSQHQESWFLQFIHTFARRFIYQNIIIVFIEWPISIYTQKFVRKTQIFQKITSDTLAIFPHWNIFRPPCTYTLIAVP